MIKTIDTKLRPTHDEIAVFAYHLWESEGRQDGRDAEYWFRAQEQLCARNSQTGSARSSAAAPAAPAQREPEKKRKPANSTGARKQPAYA